MNAINDQYCCNYAETLKQEQQTTQKTNSPHEFGDLQVSKYRVKQT